MSEARDDGRTSTMHRLTAGSLLLNILVGSMCASAFACAGPRDRVLNTRQPVAATSALMAAGPALMAASPALMAATRAVMAVSTVAGMPVVSAVQIGSWAEAALASMSLDTKVGQLLFPAVNPSDEADGSAHWDQL